MQQLYDDHAEALWGYCLHLTNDRAGAEDVAQETLLRAWRHATLLTESRGSVRSWLLTVARNIVIDEWRSRRHRSEISTAEPPETDPSRSGGNRDLADDVALSGLVTDAVATLSADHRAVLVECYYRGRSVAEASRRLGVPEGTVKSRTHYALRALRQALQDRGWNGEL